MSVATAYVLQVGSVKKDISLAALYMDARHYRDIYCPDLDEKYPIGRVYSEVVKGCKTYYPEVLNSTISLGAVDSLEAALGAIASAIGLD